VPANLIKIEMNIDNHVNEFIALWHQTSASFPHYSERFSAEQKNENQAMMQKLSELKKHDAMKLKSDSLQRDKLMRQLKANFGALLKNVFRFSDNELTVLSGMNITASSKIFMKMARDFDPEIKIEDIFQASRNLWIVNSLQVMMGSEVKVTPSVFAYSMLYPYSDNYLDDAHVSNQEKIAFSKRFRLRLQGAGVEPANKMERQIFDLVGIIESEWDRDTFPNLFQSLLAIHDAQTRSIFLLKNDRLSEEELLSVCIEKGGTSVLADGYLIAGSLTPAQELFCFGFGTFLQFVDDIQDVEEDIAGEVCTFFTRSAIKGKLDGDFNRTLRFTDKVLDTIGTFSNQPLNEMQQVMSKSIRYLMVEAVALNSNRFKQEFAEELESYAPLGFDFIRARRNRMESNKISFIRQFEGMYSSEERFEKVSA
jgi:hypothetical protein